ncbi:MAG: glycosyltransferase family 2 protein [Pseudomonadota bacterium]
MFSRNETGVDAATVLLDPPTQGWFSTAVQAVALAVRHWRFDGTTTTPAAPLHPGEQALCLASAAAPGWYMLELCVRAGGAMIEGAVELRCAQGTGSVARLRLPLHSNRVCKRLILLPSTQAVCLALPSGPVELEITTFRLVPVTAGFARSRMLRKLQAQHPLYRAHPGRATGPKPAGGDGPLTRLWHDYNALFAARQELVPYAAWLGQYGPTTASEQERMRARLAALASAPSFAVVVIASAADAARLAASVDSVRRQQYVHWQLIVVKPAAGALPGEAEHEENPGQCVLTYADAADLPCALDRAVAAADAGWIQFLQAGDLLAPDALACFAAELADSPGCSLAYSDEDSLAGDGERHSPCCKPDWDIDLVHSQNYVGASAAYRLALVRAAGPFRPEHNGAQLFDLLLRCAERLDGDQVRHVQRILLSRPADRTDDETASGERANSAGVGALAAHFDRLGIAASAAPDRFGYRVRYAVPAPAPLVTLIIPTRNGLALLRRCIESILDTTTYPHYEVMVVDNGSDEPATLAYLQQLVAQKKATVLRQEGPFNYSALNNAAVKQARGELVGLVNNDIEVISPNWLSEMVGHALRPDVGAVGARLWYANDTLQHAGVILGMEGTAGHLHRFLARGQPGYCARAVLTQSFSAVTGACLLVRKQSYQQAGGLNEVDLAVACNDVDFCLRLRALGYRNVWTPYAELYHHESSSRGLDDSAEKVLRAARENAYLHRRWGPLLAFDPAYNPSLSLDFTDVVLAWPPRERVNQERT